MDSEKTYEMLWDCAYCGTKKLLGLTHRHCPSCGAPQDPGKRYFPPDDEKVAVEDHVFTGADVLCPACQTANGKAAKHCGNCGSPLQGGKEAALQQEQVVPDGAAAAASAGAVPAAPQQKKGPNKVLFGCGALLVVGVLLSVIAFFVVNSLWTKDAALEVTGHTWRHEVPVERYETVKTSSDCSKMPKDAERVTREKRDPVCKTRKVDQGDGTYKEKRECKDREDKCSYYVGKWKTVRTEKTSGAQLDDDLRWPAVRLGKKGRCEGCEREGDRKAVYTVRFKDTASGEEQSCSYGDVKRWRSFGKGTAWEASVGGLTGGLDCDSLRPAK